jgi:hypothetical protein
MIIEATNKRTKQKQRFDVSGPAEGIDGSDTAALAQFNSTHGRTHSDARIVHENEADVARGTVTPREQDDAESNQQ